MKIISYIFIAALLLGALVIDYLKDTRRLAIREASAQQPRRWQSGDTVWYEIDSIPYISALNSGMFLVQFLTLMPTLATDVIALGGMYALVPAESLSSNAAYAVSDVMTKEEKIDLMIRKFGINKKGGEANG